MKIKISKETEINPEYDTIVKTILPLVMVFLQEKYKLNAKEIKSFNELEVRLSCTIGRNLFFPNSKVAVIRVASTRLYLYDIEEAGKTTPKEGLPVGVGVYLACSLIHELTHYIQMIQNRPFLELETTCNEVNFLKKFCYLTYELLIHSKNNTTIKSDVLP